jgi:nucleoside-diphosphate kinase
MIKPDCYLQMGKIIDQIQQSGFVINKLKMSRFNPSTASAFYAEHQGKPFFPNLSEFMCSDVAVGMELVAGDAVAKWREVIGPTNTANAKAQAPGSIRATFGTDGTKNAVHGSDSVGSYKRECNYWFGGDDPERRPMQTTAVLDNCSLCLVKPHILREGNAGKVIDAILEAGFEISALEMFNLNRAVIEEFYCVYKNVVPEYLPVIENFTSGPILALEIRQQNAVSAFRDFCGPHDPEIAKHLRPNTLR